MLEKEFNDLLSNTESFKTWAFKGIKIPYTISKIYNPDFTIEEGDKRYYIETKGYFQDSAEAAKYLWVKEVLGPNEELVFVLENPDTKIPYLKKRVDGSRMTMKEWVEKNGFRWYTLETFEEGFIDVQTVV